MSILAVLAVRSFSLYLDDTLFFPRLNEYKEDKESHCGLVDSLLTYKIYILGPHQTSSELRSAFLTLTILSVVHLMDEW